MPPKSDSGYIVEPSHDMDWTVVADIGKIRTRRVRGRKRWYLDFHPYVRDRNRFLWGDRGAGFQNEAHAVHIQGRIQALFARGLPLSDAIGEFRQASAKPNLISEKLPLWLESLRRGGEHEPYTISQYKGYVKPTGHFSYWSGKTIHDVSYVTLEEWTYWLSDRHQSGKSQKNILTAFRSFLRWLRQRDKSYVISEFPHPKAIKKMRETMSLIDQAAALAAVPESDRGIFFAMAHLTNRPGEARASLVKHYDFRTGWLWIGEALKGGGSAAPRGQTKTGAAGNFPVSKELRMWIERHTPTSARFEHDAPLFPNPRTGKPYGRKTLRNLWVKACSDADVDYVPLYAATKHSTLSELARAGVSLEDLQNLTRHKSVETTRLYLSDYDERKAETVELRDRLARGEKPRSSHSHNKGA